MCHSRSWPSSRISTPPALCWDVRRPQSCHRLCALRWGDMLFIGTVFLAGVATVAQEAWNHFETASRYRQAGLVFRFVPPRPIDRVERFVRGLVNRCCVLNMCLLLPSLSLSRILDRPRKRSQLCSWFAVLILESENLSNLGIERL